VEPNLFCHAGFDYWDTSTSGIGRPLYSTSYTDTAPRQSEQLFALMSYPPEPVEEPCPFLPGPRQLILE